MFYSGKSPPFSQHFPLLPLCAIIALHLFPVYHYRPNSPSHNSLLSIPVFPTQEGIHTPEIMSKVLLYDGPLRLYYYR